MIVDKARYSFETVELFNRLEMQIKVDILPVTIEDKLIVIVRANEGYHRTLVSKNIEQIAFQLKEKLSQEGLEFSIVEYVDRHYKDGGDEQWWQWRFNWVGKTPLSGQRYALSASRVGVIQTALDAQAVDLMCAM